CPLPAALIPSAWRFFFFQAEDGIRDFHVTGVQTCALPICRGVRGPSRGVHAPPAHLDPGARGCGGASMTTTEHTTTQTATLPDRSEERRVGKERIAPGPADDEKRRVDDRDV